MAAIRIIQSSIRDVIPTGNEISPKLIKLTEYYYNKSIQVLGTFSTTEELERAHICSILAVKKLKRELKLPAPCTRQIALPPNKLNKLMLQITNAVTNLTPGKNRYGSGSRSPASSPSKILSPSRTRTNILSPQSPQSAQSVVKSASTSKTSVSPGKENRITPSRKLLTDAEDFGVNTIEQYAQLAKQQPNTLKSGNVNLTGQLKSLYGTESNLEPDKITKKRKSNSRKSILTGDDVIDLASPTDNSPKRKTKSSREVFATKSELKYVNKDTTHKYSPRKSSPLKSTVPDTTFEDDQNKILGKDVTTEDIVSICNTLRIPTKTTYQILALYKTMSLKLKEQWGLICGIITIVFTRIFYRELESRSDLRGKFFNKLMNFQRGGLTNVDDIKHWTKTVESMVLESEAWIKALEIKYKYQVKTNSDDYSNVRYLYSTGTMLNPEVDFLNKHHTAKYDQWVLKVKRDIEMM